MPGDVGLYFLTAITVLPRRRQSCRHLLRSQSLFCSHYGEQPSVDYERGEAPLDSMNMPIQREEFGRMSRYGRAGLQAVVLVSMAKGSDPHG